MLQDQFDRQGAILRFSRKVQESSKLESIRNVVDECQKRGYFKPTFEGDIYFVSEIAKQVFGLEN